MIVMACDGRRGLSAMVIGSETQKVVTHSHVPVTIYWEH
jgi:nucleotide-binding universal stress UspA family protein